MSADATSTTTTTTTINSITSINIMNTTKGTNQESKTQWNIQTMKHESYSQTFQPMVPTGVVQEAFALSIWGLFVETRTTTTTTTTITAILLFVLGPLVLLV